MTETASPLSMALDAKFQELLAEQIRSGQLDDMLRKKLTNLVDGLLDDQLRSWSPLGERLKKQIGAALNVNLEDLGLGGYNVLVAEVVRARMDAQTKGEWAEHLKQQVDDMLRGAPSELKLSYLFEKFAEGWADQAHDGEWAHATMVVEPSEYGSTWISLDPEPYENARDSYRFMWRLALNKDGQLWRAEQAHEAAKSRGQVGERHSFFSAYHGFEGLLFQLRAGKTKIIVDRSPGLHGFEYPERQCEC